MRPEDCPLTGNTSICADTSEPNLPTQSCVRVRDTVREVRLRAVALLPRWRGARRRGPSTSPALASSSTRGSPRPRCRVPLGTGRGGEDRGTRGSRTRAQALRGAADVYWLELHDVPKAVSVYRELVAQAPDAPETAEGHVVLAGILESHYRDLRGAISELTAALAREPATAPDLRYHVAKLYFELGDYQQSELEARTLIERFPCQPPGGRRVDAGRPVALDARRNANARR